MHSNRRAPTKQVQYGGRFRKMERHECSPHMDKSVHHIQSRQLQRHAETDETQSCQRGRNAHRDDTSIDKETCAWRAFQTTWYCLRIVCRENLRHLVVPPAVVSPVVRNLSVGHVRTIRFTCCRKNQIITFGQTHRDNLPKYEPAQQGSAFTYCRLCGSAKIRTW